MSILRPELRARDEQLLGMGKHDRKKARKERERTDRLDRELNGLGKNGKTPKKPRTSQFRSNPIHGRRTALPPSICGRVDTSERAEGEGAPLY